MSPVYAEETLAAIATPKQVGELLPRRLDSAILFFGLKIRKADLDLLPPLDLQIDVRPKNIWDRHEKGKQ